MKTYVLDIIPQIQNFSKKLNNITLLTNHHWVILSDDLNYSKKVFIFRKKGKLLVSTNGKVEKAKWEYLNSNSLLIDIGVETYIFKHGFFDENILALQLDGEKEYAILINESNYHGNLNSLEAIADFLSQKYMFAASPFKIESKKVIKNFYVINGPESGYTFKMGHYWGYVIEFHKKLKYRIYQRRSDYKFFIYTKNDIVLFGDIDTCIDYLEKYGIYYNLMI